MKPLIVLAMLCAAMSPRCYAEDRLMADAYTKHSSVCRTAYREPCERWEQPRRLSWQHDITEYLSSDVGVGTNSYGRLSANIGALYQPINLGPIKAGIFGAIASGYTCKELRTCYLVGGLVATARAGNSYAQVLYVPSIGDGTVSVVNFRVGMGF